MLLYAKTEEAITPDCSYVMSGNKISVKTLDLNKEFKLIKDGYIFEFNYNFGHINVDNELTGECEDCIEVGMGIIFPDQQSFEAKYNEWLIKGR